MTTAPTSPVLVIGGTGKTGRRVAAQLRAAGHEVRPASRSSATRFDWDDPSTWAPALDGAGGLYLMPPETGDLDPFIAEVERSSVDRIVHLSAREPTQGGGDDLARFEDTVRASSRPWTILRPAWFDQNFDEGLFVGPLADGTLRLPTGDGREPFIDAEDIAAVAVAALTEPGHEGRTYELSGPETLSFGDAVATIADVSGRDVAFEAVTAEAWVTEPWVAAMPAPVLDVMQNLFAAIGRGDNDIVSTGVEDALGRPPTSFAAWAERTYRKG